MLFVNMIDNVIVIRRFMEVGFIYKVVNLMFG